MPSGNQNPPQGQGHQNGGSAPGAREQIQNIGGKIQEGAANVGNRLREGFDTSREEMARRYRRVEGTLARNPTPSVLISFGIGFGVGLVVTSLLTQREETWAERYLPETSRKVRRTFRDTSKTIGDASESTRDAAQDAIHNLADSLRNLPDMIASRVSSLIRR